MHLSAADRSAVVARAIEATVAGDTSAVAELFTPDVVAWSPTVAVSSLVELSVEIEDREDAFSEAEVAIRRFVSAGDHVCAEWVVSAALSGPVGVGDTVTTLPTGRRITVRGATVADFEGDRICAIRHYWDEVGLLAELLRSGDAPLT